MFHGITASGLQIFSNRDLVKPLVEARRLQELGMYCSVKLCTGLHVMWLLKPDCRGK
jgi:hypothetical protein